MMMYKLMSIVWAGQKLNKLLRKLDITNDEHLVNLYAYKGLAEKYFENYHNHHINAWWDHRHSVWDSNN